IIAPKLHSHARTCSGHPRVVSAFTKLLKNMVLPRRVDSRDKPGHDVLLNLRFIRLFADSRPLDHAAYAANSRISRTCAGPTIGRGLRGTHGVPIACSAIRAKLSGPILTAPRLRGMPSPPIKASSTSPASSSG